MKKTKAQELGITEFPYYEFNKNGNITYYETSDGTWWKGEFNDKDNQTYYENSTGFKEYHII
tara:strand:- start:282 stop:467 length:186 start_codon:yes stop_codon:yes gene_type:complete